MLTTIRVRDVYLTIEVPNDYYHIIILTEVL